MSLIPSLCCSEKNDKPQVGLSNAGSPEDQSVDSYNQNKGGLVIIGSVDFKRREIVSWVDWKRGLEREAQH